MQISAHWLYLLELVVTLLSLLLAFRAPSISLRIYSRTLLQLRRIARRPYLSALLVAALPLLLRFALLPWIPVPQPQIQEEFSYLLGADTFAHGRLANPPHPMAVFFDNIQLIQTPHYASARPPGQAVFLCLGQVLFGNAMAGRLFERGADVRGVLLDAARMDPACLGPVDRPHLRNSIGRLYVLDQFLLGRIGDRAGQRAGGGRSSPPAEQAENARRVVVWRGVLPACFHPAL